ncbi:MAG: hypothetical protein GY791_18710 [Alphaproteobacteria bacterium]|nr:hypothetical protein [Alphaproteobacteria bacterium]
MEFKKSSVMRPARGGLETASPMWKGRGMGQMTTRRALGRTAGGFAFGLVLACFAPAAAQDEAGWRGAEWGMDGAALDRVFGSDLTRLSAPLDFGPLYVDRLWRGVELGGYRFTAFLQMDRSTARLAQVLLDIRRLEAPDRVMAAVVDALGGRYGEPACRVEAAFPDGATATLAATWNGSGSTVQAGLIDMNIPGILTEDPNTKRDVRRPSYERRRIKRSSLPRRVTVRFHAAARTDLDLDYCRAPEEE